MSTPKGKRPFLFLMLAGAIAVAALAPVAANLALGGRLFDRDRGPPAPPGPGAAARLGPGVDCDLDRGPCRREGPGDLVMELDAGPRPLRTMADLHFTVRARRGAVPVTGHEVAIALSMPDMYMGENRVRLAAREDGSYSGRGVIVRCPSGGRVWNAEVALQPPAPASGAPLRASFTFEMAR